MFEDIRNSESMTSAFHAQTREGEGEEKRGGEGEGVKEEKREEEEREIKERGEERREREAYSRKSFFPLLMTAQIWPLPPSDTDSLLSLPPPLLSLLHSFSLFYSSLHARRSLRWQHSSSVVFAQLNSAASPVLLTCSMHQYLGLHMLNQRQSFTKVFYLIFCF